MLHESEWQLRITDYCDQLRLKWHHETDSRRTREGWPDLVIAGPGGIAIIELKTDSKKSKVSAGQKEWLDVLYDAPTTGVIVDVWRPAQWESKVIPTIRMLAGGGLRG